MDHDAVGAAIDPAVVGIAHDVVAAGADIAAAVLRVPLRRREFGDVDGVALHDVLHHRAGVDEFRRDALEHAGVIDAKAFAQLQLGQLGGKSERHVLALAGEEIDQEAAALERAGHVLEHEARRVVGVRRHFGDHADILLVGLARRPPSPRRAFSPLRAIAADRDRAEMARYSSRPRSKFRPPIGVDIGIGHEASWDLGINFCSAITCTLVSRRREMLIMLRN